MKARSLTRETILNIDMTQQAIPDFKVGDSIEVSQRIKEGDKERIQVFAGDVIGRRNNGTSSTITVRKIGANGIGVEKIFPIHSPTIAEIRITKIGMARRAKLYYVRERLGKAARIKEKVLTKEQRATLLSGQSSNNG